MNLREPWNIRKIKRWEKGMGISWVHNLIFIKRLSIEILLFLPSINLSYLWIKVKIMLGMDWEGKQKAYLLIMILKERKSLSSWYREGTMVENLSSMPKKNIRREDKSRVKIWKTLSYSRSSSNRTRKCKNASIIIKKAKYLNKIETGRLKKRQQRLKDSVCSIYRWVNKWNFKLRMKG